MQISNCDGRVLLANFVEERRVADLDTMKDAPPGMGKGQYFLNGHKGILTMNWSEPLSNVTLSRETYVPHDVYQEKAGTRKGIRKDLLIRKVMKSLREDSSLDKPPEPTDFRSETMISHNIEGFTSHNVLPTRPHDYRVEQPVSYWTEHKDKIAGVSQIKTGDTAFRKNAAFSTPTEESWESSKPYEQPRYPNM